MFRGTQPETVQFTAPLAIPPLAAPGLGEDGPRSFNLPSREGSTRGKHQPARNPRIPSGQEV